VQLLALVDKVENYVLEMRSDMEDDYTQYYSVESPCDYVPCECDECVKNKDWGVNLSFTTSVLAEKYNESISDTTTCVAAEANNYFLQIASEEYSDATQVGTFYAGFQKDGALIQWPAVSWCSDSYDPRFRPWYSAALTNPKVLVVAIDVSASMIGDR
jgi:hypothetical protein